MEDDDIFAVLESIEEVSSSKDDETIRLLRLIVMLMADIKAIIRKTSTEPSPQVEFSSTTIPGNASPGNLATMGVFPYAPNGQL